MIRQAHKDDSQRIGGIHVASWQVAYKGIIPQNYLDELDVHHREKVWERTIECGQNSSVLVSCEADDTITCSCHVIDARFSLNEIRYRMEL